MEKNKLKEKHFNRMTACSKRAKGEEPREEELEKNNWRRKS
jgi:hypothetical protein